MVLAEADVMNSQPLSPIMSFSRCFGVIECFFFWLYLSLQLQSSLSSSSGSQRLLMSSLLSRNLMKGTEAELSPSVRDQVSLASPVTLPVLPANSFGTA